MIKRVAPQNSNAGNVLKTLCQPLFLFLYPYLNLLRAPVCSLPSPTDDVRPVGTDLDYEKEQEKEKDLLLHAIQMRFRPQNQRVSAHRG